MPIEIMELVVRATVAANEQGSSRPDTNDNTPQAQQTAVTDLQKTVKTTLDLLKNKKER